MKILLFLRRKPHRRPSFLLARYATDFPPGCPNPLRGAQVETPQRVAPHGGVFFRSTVITMRQMMCALSARSPSPARSCSQAPPVTRAQSSRADFSACDLASSAVTSSVPSGSLIRSAPSLIHDSIEFSVANLDGPLLAGHALCPDSEVRVSGCRESCGLRTRDTRAKSPQIEEGFRPKYLFDRMICPKSCCNFSGSRS